MRLVAASLLVAFVGLGPATAADRKLTSQERIELIRGLSAEYATAKAAIPRSKKTLVFHANGSFDKAVWEKTGKESGPAARIGDAIQVTKVTIEDDRIVFELNGGYKGGPKWYQRIQIGVGTQTTPVGSGSQSTAPAGTTLALVFPGQIPHVDSAKVKELLAPVLDFQKHSPTELYVDTLPAPVQQAIKDKKAVEGMNRDQVILAMGKPDNKVRETVDGVEREDWVYGTPPGRIVFVTFEGDKVVRVKEAYAQLGGSVAPPLPVPR